MTTMAPSATYRARRPMVENLMVLTTYLACACSNQFLASAIPLRCLLALPPSTIDEYVPESHRHAA